MSEEKKLSRIQLRFLDRLKKETDQTFSMLFERFFNAFMESDDPEGKEMDELFVGLDAKWKTYCSRKHLTDDVKKAFSKEVAALIKDYQNNKSTSPAREAVQP